MTKLQAQACQLIGQLPEDKLEEIVTILKKATSENKEEKQAEQKVDRQKRHEAFEGLLKLREELIAMNIDWKAEVKQAMLEKYGV